MKNVAAPVRFPAKSVDRTILAACVGYALLLVAFWLVALHFAMEDRIHGHMASSFTAFALLLAPYWFFGFGAAEMLQRSAAEMLQRLLGNRAMRVLVPGLLLVPLPHFFRAPRRVLMDYCGDWRPLPGFSTVGHGVIATDYCLRQPPTHWWMSSGLCGFDEPGLDGCH